MIVMRRTPEGLAPIDDEAREALSKIGIGKEVMVEAKTARSPRQHRLFFALLNLVVENTDHFASKDMALVALKVACGEVDTWIDPSSGKAFFIPRSISFQKMEGERFKRLFDRALYVITERWLVGTSAEELRKEVIDLVDGPERASLGRRAA